MNQGLISTLSWMLPVMGLSLYVLAIPALRRNVSRPLERAKSVFFGPPADPDVPAASDPEAEVDAGTRPRPVREDDPEVARFNTGIFDDFPGA